ncbi:DUF1292 domain-containing protein [Clostridium botulinum C]|uniref:DUF1292 domain-containing protein n=3 Tax=Clostridium botulinum TaxID=1491 RepID=K0IUS2_CLOBO|nr:MULTISPECIES: DUF1292 domain-containing protein [Clostridium]EGO87011.1 hypothetical protein CBCST_14646 [Clostridium botulinum C str. Stockholm]AYF55060.1 DUF1292 domain-containing protein [Clostridium novyi]EES91813.1 conserved hypothetical protein [Clostridium botulinum D str. 1873]KEI10705.1 hypothetical protein Z957_02915 [Clostridium sp. K25]MBO3442037.1 DUF1292 domain-containing protein [Clostridium haemolyticum]
MDKEKLEGCGCGEHHHDHDHEECGCGCGCHEHESLMVELEDEHGNVVPCEVIDGFEYKENEYALVQNPEDNSVYLFKVIGEGEDGELVVPEDEEFNEVTAYYETLLENEE